MNAGYRPIRIHLGWDGCENGTGPDSRGSAHGFRDGHGRINTGETASERVVAMAASMGTGPCKMPVATIDTGVEFVFEFHRNGSVSPKKSSVHWPIAPGVKASFSFRMNLLARGCGFESVWGVNNLLFCGRKRLIRE